MALQTRNIISTIVGTQVPDFVRVDHPTFVAFLEAYFEWLERSEDSGIKSPLELKDAFDIDRTVDSFVQYFRDQFLVNFPQELAINQTTNRPVDERTLIKNIKAFYTNKGTEKSYEFLFRILYDTAVEFYYPKIDILRASDGKWIKQKSLRTTNTKGPELTESITRRILQIDENTTLVTASAKVSSIVTYQLGSFEVAELFLTNVNGEFVANMPYSFYDSDNELQEELNIYSVVQGISSYNAGYGYKVGDNITFTTSGSDTGQGAVGRVNAISATGAIREIVMENFGVNYKSIPSFTISTEGGTGFSGVATLGALCDYPGYYSNNDGKLSTNKVLQDNRYYQNYSYVLKTELTVSRYRDAIKKLIHPAGLGFFGLVLIKRSIDGTIEHSNEIIRYEVPIIGHYAPYTMKTHDNLQEWFVDRMTGLTCGYSPDEHDFFFVGGETAQFIGRLTDGNPITANLLGCFAPNTPLYNSSSQDSRVNPFYVIYQHPNRRITDEVFVEIPYDLRDLVYGTGSTSIGWSEWTLTSESDKLSWYTGFSGATDSKIVELQYTPLTQFNKIGIYEFLNMRIGEHWDSTQDSGIYADYGNSPNY